MRAYVECSPNQSKKLYLIDLSIEQSTKLRGFRNSAGRFCISILPEYCSSDLTAQANKMAITTVCVQIDNCFCNTRIAVHLRASLKRSHGTPSLATYSAPPPTRTQSGNLTIELSHISNSLCKRKLIAKNNCLNVITWPDHLRVIKAIKGPVKLIKWVKIAHSFLQSVSHQFHVIILNLPI